MKKITTFFWTGILSFVLMTGGNVAYSRGPELSLELVPITTTAFSPQTFYPLDKLFELHFLVVLKNTSAKTLHFYDEGNSWGYFNLYFTLHSRSGKQIATLSKQQSGWRGNAPTSHELWPGQSDVWTVYLSDRIWRINPSINVENISAIQAHYTQSREEQVFSLQMQNDFPLADLWEGTVASRIYSLEELNLADKYKLFSSLVGWHPENHRYPLRW